jgi:hypothetical protein
MGIEDFEQLWHQRTGKTPYESVLDKSGDLEPEQFKLALARSLELADFRLVFAVDQITPSLRRIVEFLNQGSGERLAVMGLEMGRFSEGEVEILVPVTYGAELAGENAPRTAREANRWSRDQVVEALVPNPGHLTTLKALLAHADAAGAEFKGGTSRSGPSGGVYYDTENGRRSLWSVYTSSAEIVINVASVFAPAPERALQAAHVLIAAGLVESPANPDALAKKYVSVPMAKAASPAAIQGILSALDILRGNTP